VEVELILNKKGELNTQVGKISFSNRVKDLECLYFPNQRNWDSFIQDFNALYTRKTYCWEKGESEHTYYSIQLTNGEGQTKTVKLTFEKIRIADKSPLINSLTTKLLEAIPAGSAIVNLHGEVYEKNPQFDGKAWRKYSASLGNLDTWSQACVDALTYQSKQYVILEKFNKSILINPLDSGDSDSVLFLIQFDSQSQETISSKLSNSGPLQSLSLPGFQDESKTTLLNKNKFYETVLHSIPADIAVFDKDQRYAFVNKNGISDSSLRDWIIGKTDFDYCKMRGLDAKLAEERSAIFSKAIKAKKPVDLITEHNKNGETKYVLRRYQPYFKGEELLHVIGYGVDLTNQILYERKLKESEQFGRRLLDEIESNLIVLDANLDIVYANSFARVLLELSEEQFALTNFSSFLIDKEQNILKSFLTSSNEFVNQKDTLRLSLISPKYPSSIQVEVHIHPVNFEEKPCYFLTLNDLTQLTEEVEKREEAEELAKVIINTALDAVITADEDGQIIAWSHKAISMFGYEEFEVLGKKISDVIIPNELKEHHDAGMTRMKSTAKSNITGRLIRLKAVNKQGKEFPVELFINQIQVKNRRLFSAFIRDISEQVNAEQVIIQSERQLSMLLGSIPSVPYSALLVNSFEFTYLHSRVFELTGFQPNDFLDQRVNWINRIHKKDVKEVLLALQTLKDKPEVVIEYRFLNAREEYIWLRNSVKINQSKDSLPDSVTGVFEDITEKRIEVAINNEIQRAEIEILQLDWKEFVSVNDFCAQVIKKINSKLSFLDAEVWDFNSNENLFSCIASSKSNVDLRSDFTVSEMFLSKLQKETSFMLDSYFENGNLCNTEQGNCLVSGVKRDGKVKGFLIFSSNVENKEWSSHLKHFIKSISNRLSLVAESFLRRSAQAKLSKALFNGRMTVFEWYNDSNLIEWSSDSCPVDVWDTPPENLSEFLVSVYWEDKDLLQNTFDLALQKDENCSCTFRLFDNRGKMRYFDLSLNREGYQNRVFGLLKDVTSKIKAEKELKRINDGSNQLNSIIASLQLLSDERLIRKQFSSSIVNSLNIADCFFMIQSDDGYSLFEESVNTNKQNIEIQRQLIQLNQNVLKSCWESGNPLMQQIKLPVLGDKPLQFIVVPFAVSENIESLIVAYCTEVEEQSEARADFMMKCVEVLKQRLLKLRSEVALKKLNKELLTSNYQLEQYSYIVAHNLRAPFSNIKGIIDLLNLESIADEKDKMLFLKLVDTINNIDQILIDLNKLLTIQNSLDIKYERVQLEKMLNSILKTMEQDFQSIQAKVVIDLSKKSEVIACKPYILSVFQNLLSNSYKYRNPDKKLEVQIKTWEDEAGHAIIEFKDNGIGIDLTRYKDRVFKLYSRFHRHVDGSGFGLYLVKSQINAMGGEIEIESTPGFGTTFYIKIKNQ
jgi:PAS domain S-box-containing protein